MHQRLGVAAAIAVSALVSASAVHSQDNFRMLGEREIRERVVGKDITDSSHWSMYVRPDGALLGEESSTHWTGTWKIQKSKLCLSNPGSQLLDCYDVWMSGENVSLRLNKDDNNFVAVIAKHRAN
jgi:hypothetical protein